MVTFTLIAEHKIKGHFDVRWSQGSDGSFVVVYGAERHRTMCYNEAAAHFGHCVGHQATCDGRVDAWD